MTWLLDMRLQDSGGELATMVSVYDGINPSSPAALQAAVHGRDLLIVAHGFNVSRDEGRDKLTRWQAWQSLPGNVFYIGVLWPGDSSWAHGLDYPGEITVAERAGTMLARFLLETFPAVGAISLASHSLGARLMLQLVRTIQNKLQLKNLMLMAGAIDDTCLANEYADVLPYVEKISVLASGHDEVLALAFPLGNLVSGILARDCPYMQAALGREGPRNTPGGTVQSGWAISDGWDFGHHNYFPLTPYQAPPQPAQADFPAPASDAPPWSQDFEEWRSAWAAQLLCRRFWPG